MTCTLQVDDYRKETLYIPLEIDNSKIAKASHPLGKGEQINFRKDTSDETQSKQVKYTVTNRNGKVIEEGVLHAGERMLTLIPSTKMKCKVVKADIIPSPTVIKFFGGSPAGPEKPASGR